MLVPVLLFALGLILLIKGGDWFVDGAVGIAHRFHLPELLIGATIVSIGTTLPEVMVSSQAAFAGNAGISYGNAIGSIICNTSLIAALTIAIRPSAVDKKPLKLPVAAFFIAAALYAIIAYTNGGFSRLHGILFLCMFAVYILLSVREVMPASGTPPKEDSIVQSRTAAEDTLSAEIDDNGSPTASSLGKELLLLVIGAAAIAIGANLLVNNGTKIAEALGVPDSVIGLTMVALGTSLPELVTAITSLVKGHSALSLGNIIGANLFNIVLVCGAAITISPFAIPSEKTVFGMNASYLVDMPLMFLVMAIMCLPALIKGKLGRWQGILLLCIYAAFTVFQFAL